MVGTSAEAKPRHWHLRTVLEVLRFFTQTVQGRRLALFRAVWIGAPGREDELSIFGEIVVKSREQHWLVAAVIF